MPGSATLRTLLEQVDNVSALARALAGDPDSDKDPDVWRRMLYSWMRGGGISLENAAILSRHLPGNISPETLVQDETEPESVWIRGLEELVSELQQYEQVPPERAAYALQVVGVAQGMAHAQLVLCQAIVMRLARAIAE